MGFVDRRAVPRHRPLPVRVHVVWTDGQQLQQAVAQLCDLSNRGAAIALDVPAPEAGSVVIGLDGLPLDSWVNADIVDVVPNEFGERRIGLKFADRCPNRFFQQALHGEAVSAGAGRPARATEPDSCWSKRTQRSRDSILGRDRLRDSRWLKEEPMLPTVLPGPLVPALR